MPTSTATALQHIYRTAPNYLEGVLSATIRDVLPLYLSEDTRTNIMKEVVISILHNCFGAEGLPPPLIPTDYYVVVSEYDYGESHRKRFDSHPIAWETNLDQATRAQAEAAAKTRGRTYGKCRVARLFYIDEE